MGEFKLLDCTLRDGAYIVNSMFGDVSIKGLIDKLNKANIDIIECGWLKNDEHKKDSSFYHVISEVNDYVLKPNPDCKYVLMIDWDRYDISLLPTKDEKNICDSIRVVFPFNHFKEGLNVGKEIKDKGYNVYFQAANTLAYSDDDLKVLAFECNKISPLGISIVDTFGAMYEDDLERIVSVLDKELNENIALGFHSHNNQQLAFSNAIHFMKLLKNSEREAIIDASLCGMGRGAGNATTELVANYLNQKYNGNYDLDVIMDAIDIYMTKYAEKYKWGYSTEYCIAGIYCSHVNNIAYLTKKHKTNARDMRNVIESLSPEDRKKYDYNLLEEKYIQNQSRVCDDSLAIDKLKKDLSDKVLLIAPGKSIIKEEKKIKDFIDQNKDVVTISVNALNSIYDSDFLFLTNTARYDYARIAYKDKYNSLKRILLSNIKTSADEGDYIVQYDKAIKRGWEHFDNAVICALRLLSFLDTKEVYLSGFDGFKGTYNESYADESLPTVNPGKEWEELNEEIKDMFEDVKKYSNDMKINFITESIFA